MRVAVEPLRCSLNAPRVICISSSVSASRQRSAVGDKGSVCGTDRLGAGLERGAGADWSVGLTDGMRWGGAS